MLDNFATVNEAVTEMQKEAFRPVSVVAPNGVEGKIHLSISDASGDSAIFEYIGGKLMIHHGRQYQVMTNSPAYDQQIALNEYWKQIGGTVMSCNTSSAALVYFSAESLESREFLSIDAALQWNAIALDAIRTDSTAPPLAARDLAIMHVAIFDAVNSIDRQYAPFADNARVSDIFLRPQHIQRGRCSRVEGILRD